MISELNLAATSSPTLLRSFLALSIIIMGIGLYMLTNRLILARARSTNLSANFTHKDGPTLLYFTTPTCSPCKNIQRPVIQSLIERMGSRLHVIEINAEVQTDIANDWGVMSVPTTYLIDQNGYTRHVNQGIASADKLLRQINEILE